MSVTSGTAHVWWARLQDARPGHMALLDETERQRWAAYRRGADRDRFLVGCALAKTAIAACTGRRPAEVSFDRTCRHCGKSHGKPVSGDAGVEHSVTHSGDLVAVAVATAPIGVDVEQLDRQGTGQADAEALAPRVLARQEQAVLAATPSSDRARRFLIAWTRKEAVTKAIGEGLRAPFSEVVVAADTGGPRLVSWPYPHPPGGVSLRDLDPGPGYVAALAVIGPCGLVRARNGSALLSASAG